MELKVKNSRIYLCYKTIICKQENGTTYLDINNWDSGKAVSGGRNAFLGETKRITQKKIDLGIYQLKDLNNGKIQSLTETL